MLWKISSTYQRGENGIQLKFWKFGVRMKEGGSIDGEQAQIKLVQAFAISDFHIFLCFCL